MGRDGYPFVVTLEGKVWAGYGTGFQGKEKTCPPHRVVTSKAGVNDNDVVAGGAVIPLDEKKICEWSSGQANLRPARKDMVNKWLNEDPSFRKLSGVHDDISNQVVDMVHKAPPSNGNVREIGTLSPESVRALYHLSYKAKEQVATACLKGRLPDTVIEMVWHRIWSVIHQRRGNDSDALKDASLADNAQLKESSMVHGKRWKVQKISDAAFFKAWRCANDRVDVDTDQADTNEDKCWQFLEEAELGDELLDAVSALIHEIAWFAANEMWLGL